MRGEAPAVVERIRIQRRGKHRRGFLALLAVIGGVVGVVSVFVFSEISRLDARPGVELPAAPGAAGALRWDFARKGAWSYDCHQRGAAGGASAEWAGTLTVESLGDRTAEAWLVSPVATGGEAPDRAALRLGEDGRPREPAGARAALVALALALPEKDLRPGQSDERALPIRLAVGGAEVPARAKIRLTHDGFAARGGRGLARLVGRIEVPRPEGPDAPEFSARGRLTVYFDPAGRCLESAELSLTTAAVETELRITRRAGKP